MKVYLCRHGQTEWNLQGRLQGDLDSPLTYLGRQQAIRAVPQLQQLMPKKIICSDLGRSIDTAHIINRKLALPLTMTHLLRERCFGQLQGVSPEYHSQLWAQYHRRHQQNSLNIVGAESALAIRYRVEQFVSLLLQQPHESVLVVGHGEWIRSFLNWHHGLQPWSASLSLPDNCQLLTVTLQTTNRPMAIGATHASHRLA